MIPFKYGTIVSGKDFCGRKEIIKEIKELIASSQNLLIQGERRIGKTSLVYETAKDMKGYRLLIIDLMLIKTSHDFCKRIIKSIITLESNDSYITQAFKFLKSLRPKLGIDPVSGLPTLSLDPSIKITPDSLEEIFDLIKTINEKKRLIVFFDEFQDILNIKDSDETLALLRSKIQYHSEISYIFAGSIRQQMEKIFTHHDSPLFKSAIKIDLGPIEKKIFSDFIKKKFKIDKRRIDDGALERIFIITDNITGDVQQFCEALWSVTSGSQAITEKDLQAALELIFSREEKSYELVISQLTAIQFQCLTGLAKTGGKEPTSSEFLKITGINQPSTISRALSRLLKLNIIYRLKNEYRFINPFFKAWVIYKSF